MKVKKKNQNNHRKEYSMGRIRSNGGFTFIELMIIIVVLGILAAVAIPKYQDIVQDAKTSSTKGALGGLRSGISTYYANTAVTTGFATWPPIDSLRSVGVVMAYEIPANPFQHPENAPDSIVTGVTKGVIVGTRGGWAYKPSTGQIWPNTNVSGENEW